MRSGAAAGCGGYFHETAYYSSDAQLQSIVVPFLREGLEHGEPTVVAFGERNAQLVRDALPDGSGVTFMRSSEVYHRPAATIREYQELFAGLVAGGAGQIRVVGDVPHPGVGTPWHSWARYEMAINALYDQYPVWGMCPYDLRTTPDDVLELVASVHPHVAHDDGRHVDGPALGPLEEMSARLPAPVPYPIEHTDPAVRIEAPELRVARSAASQLGAAAGLSPADRGDLCVAVSEVLSNAQQHGVPPVQLRGWSEPGRVVIAVTDRGGGPGDPLCGLSSLGRPLGAGGLGMWVAHQMCADVTMHRDDHGFTVRLVAGDPRLS